MLWLWVTLVIAGLSFAMRLVIKWIINPIRVRNRISITGTPAYQPTTMEQLTPEQKQFVGSLIHQFQAIGFETVANVHNPASVPGVRGFRILLLNRATGDMANLVMSSAGNVRSKVFNITSKFDRIRIITGVNPTVGLGAKDPFDDSAIFSWVQEPAILLEAHRRRLRCARRENDRRICPSPGEEFTFLERDWIESVQRSVNRGDRYFDPVTGKYWMTWRAAFLFAWKLQEPIKTWRVRLRDRRARALWKQLGMEEYRQPQLAAPPSGPAAVAPTTAKPIAPITTSLNDPPLTYQTVLPEGEIRQEQHGDHLVVRMGTPTLGAHLVQQWGNLLRIVVWLVILPLSLITLSTLRFISLPRLGAPGFGWVLAMLPLLWALFLISDVMQLWRGLARVRGTIVLTGSDEGLRFASAPGRYRDGFLPRETIETLRVRMVQPRLRRLLQRAVYQLEAKQFGSRRLQPLLIGSDIERLKEARAALMRAMGIESIQSATATSPAAAAI